MSQGTTAGGQFRFPYQRVDLVPDQPNLELWMDRDRALEDYITSAADMPFVVVASDGSGDYTSIKEAVEATSGTALLFVLPGTYDDDGSGDVEVAAGAHVTVWASSPFNLGTSNTARQRWDFDGFDPPGTGTASVTLIGLEAAVSSGVWAPANGGTFTLIANNCTLSGGSSLHDGNSNTGRNFRFTDCDVDTLMHVTASGSPEIVAVHSTLSNFSQGNTTISGNPTLHLENCAVTMSGALVYDGSGTSGPAVSLLNCSLSAQGSSISLNTPSYPRIIGCTGSIGDVTIRSDNSSAPEGIKRWMVADNILSGCTLSLRDDGGAPSSHQSAGYVSGIYRRLILHASAASASQQYPQVANVVLDFSDNAGADPDALNISGDGNVVTAVMRLIDGARAVTVSGDNNMVLYRASGAGSPQVSDTGSNNLINALPPSGAAGGHLAGTYPDPTFSDDAFGAAGYPLDVAASEADGTDGAAARSDHVHAHGSGYLPNAHHDQAHDIDGADHTASGLTTGHVLTATGATSFAFQSPSGSGNLLTGNQASLETNTTGWAAEANCSIARSTSQASHGAASLELTAS